MSPFCATDVRTLPSTYRGRQKVEKSRWRDGTEGEQRMSGTIAPCASAVCRMVGCHRRGPRLWVRSDLCRAEHARSAGPAGCDRCTASWRDAPCACGPPAACSPHVAASNAHNAFWAPGGPCSHVRSAKWRHRIVSAHGISVDSPLELCHILETQKVYVINLYFQTQTLIVAENKNLALAGANAT